MLKTYSELIKIDDYLDRFDYLKIYGFVGDDTFGSKRYLNQALYHSYEWLRLKRNLIIRDEGCDMAFPGYTISGKVMLHHLNPITPKQIADRDPIIFDPNNLVCVSYSTHQAIHYGSADILPSEPVERRPGDTKPW